MKTTARFEVQRRKALEKLFTSKRLTTLWRKLVKDQMRDLDIGDLHDYYDFNYAVESRIDSIIEKILSGQYRAEAPLIFRSEKQFGVCRHMLVPSPADAVVFQTLTDELYEPIKKAQPWKGAYYSRDRHRLHLPHEEKEARSYPWFVLWPKFQQQIWAFSKAHKYLVTTDLSNYFDNIALRELRHVISSITKVDEVYLDLLFSLIEDLSWNPDYLPPSHKGLPTINIEAPRLLAHALLFEVDEVLKERTNKCFVRWMDDINFGVDNHRTASIILGEVNDVLKSRGLALNLAKTSIYSSKQARHHFLFKENLRLDKLHKRARGLSSIKSRRRLALRIAKELASHIETCDARNRDKVTKRYLTVLATLGRPVALDAVVALFKKNAEVRSNVLRYLTSLPFSASSATAVLQVLKPAELLDDVTIIQIIDAVVAWRIPRDAAGIAFTEKIARRLSKPKTAFEWLARLRFLAKYGRPMEVVGASKAGKSSGAREPFFARQTMAALARGLGRIPKQVRRFWQDELTHGSGDPSAVASNLLHFLDNGFPSKNHRAYLYLFPDKHQKPYPLPKFLLLCVIAASEKNAGSLGKRPEVSDHVLDPWYRHWLRQIHPHWF